MKQLNSAFVFLVFLGFAWGVAIIFGYTAELCSSGKVSTKAFTRICSGYEIKFKGK